MKSSSSCSGPSESGFCNFSNSSSGTVVSTSAGIYIGAFVSGSVLYPWSGYMGEVLIYNKVLSDVYRQYIEGYLAWKWGMQSYLTPTHPFYNATPQVDLLNYQFCIKGNATSTVPTTDVTGSFTITSGTVGTSISALTMTVDLTRGFVFNFTANATGYENTAVGTESLFSNSIGNNNTAIGYYSFANKAKGSITIRQTQVNK